MTYKNIFPTLILHIKETKTAHAITNQLYKTIEKLHRSYVEKLKMEWNSNPTGIHKI